MQVSLEKRPTSFEKSPTSSQKSPTPNLKETHIQVSLEKSKKLVSSFNDTATAGTTLVRQAGEAKINEIKAHMAKIRQILDQV